jgi:hypothetical protein
MLTDSPKGLPPDFVADANFALTNSSASPIAEAPKNIVGQSPSASRTFSADKNSAEFLQNPSSSPSPSDTSPLRSEGNMPAAGGKENAAELERTVVDCFQNAYRLYLVMKDILIKIKENQRSGMVLGVDIFEPWHTGKRNFTDSLKKLNELIPVGESRYSPASERQNIPYSWLELFTDDYGFSPLSLLFDVFEQYIARGQSIPDKCIPEVESILQKSQQELCAAGLILLNGELMHKWSYYDPQAKGNYQRAIERVNAGRQVELDTVAVEVLQRYSRENQEQRQVSKTSQGAAPVRGPNHEIIRSLADSRRATIMIDTAA